jgi:hypothetical protein
MLLQVGFHIPKLRGYLDKRKIDPHVKNLTTEQSTARARSPAATMLIGFSPT